MTLSADFYLRAPRVCRPRRMARTAERASRMRAVMRGGKTPHLQFRDGQPLWDLSDGRPVPGAVAAPHHQRSRSLGRRCVVLRNAGTGLENS